MHPTDPAPVQEAPERGDAYGTPRRLWAALERHRPPGPSNPRWWRSPLRGPWLTSVLGAVLLAALPIVSVTGLLSWVAYGPQFGQAIPADPGGLHLPVFGWPTSPSWLFRLNQGLHVGLGLVLIPVVLAKLWSVAPKLFAWPPARSVAALRVNGADLSLDHGFPARVIVPALPGVHNTKWVRSIEFRST